MGRDIKFIFHIEYKDIGFITNKKHQQLHLRCAICRGCLVTVSGEFVNKVNSDTMCFTVQLLQVAAWLFPQGDLVGQQCLSEQLLPERSFAGSVQRSPGRKAPTFYLQSVLTSPLSSCMF